MLPPPDDGAALVPLTPPALELPPTALALDPPPTELEPGVPLLLEDTPTTPASGRYVGQLGSGSGRPTHTSQMPQSLKQSPTGVHGGHSAWSAMPANVHVGVVPFMAPSHT